MDASAFLKKLADRSSFQTSVMMDIASRAFGPPVVLAKAEVVRTLKLFARDVFGSFGQTKIVEDCFQRLRDWSERAVRNRRMSLVSQWSTARDRQAIALHEREDIDTGPAHDAPMPLDTKKIFHPSKHTPAWDLSGLCGTATWPTLSPQGSGALLAEQHMMISCHEDKCLEQASKAWKVVLLPLGTAFAQVGSDDIYMSLGHVGFTQLLGLRCQQRTTATGVRFLTLPTEASSDFVVRWFSVLDWDQFEVYPGRVVSPRHLFMSSARKLSTGQGVVFAMDPAGSCGVVHNAAINCFWQLSLTELRKVALELGVIVEGKGLFPHLNALLRNAFPKFSEVQLAAILDKRGAPLQYPLLDLLSSDAVGSTFEKDDALAAEDISRCHSR